MCNPKGQGVLSNVEAKIAGTTSRAQDSRLPFSGTRMFISTVHEHAYLGGATVYDHAPGLCFYYYGFDA